MRSIRKTALFLVLILTSLAAGCTMAPYDESTPPGPTGTQQTGTPSTPEPIAVHAFQFKTEYKEALDEAVKKFSEEYKAIALNIETVGKDQDYSAALRTKFNSGQDPALFNISSPQDIADWKPKLADLSETEAAKNAMESFLKAVTLEGKVYGLPYYIEGHGLIYNKEIFKKAQIKLERITSFKDLKRAVEELDRLKKELGIEAVFAFPAKETLLTGLHLSNLYLSAEFEGDVLKTAQAKSISFKYSDTFKQMVDLQNQYSVQPAADIDYNTQVNLFGSGKVAMIQQGNWVYTDLETASKDLAQKNIGMLHIPVSGYREDSLSIGVPLYWAVNNTKPTEVQKAAKDFINWLYLSEAGQKIITEKFKLIPAYMGYAADAVKDPLGKDIMAHISGERTINWVFQGYPPQWGTKKLGADIQLYVQGQLSWENLIKKAKASWSEARK